MNINIDENEGNSKVYKTIAARENLEERALASLTTEILQTLNVNINRLPRKCQSMLEQVARNQTSLKIQQLDPVSISLYRSKEISEKLDDEYEILQLKQKNAELQAKIDRNNRFLVNLRKDLECSKRSLASRNPNPDDIDDYIKQLKQKLTMYEMNYEMIESKYSNLNVPEAVLPKSLELQMATLHALQEEAVKLKEQADDVIFMKETKNALYRLRKL